MTQPERHHRCTQHRLLVWDVEARAVEGNPPDEGADRSRHEQAAGANRAEPCLRIRKQNLQWAQDAGWRILADGGWLGFGRRPTGKRNRDAECQ